MPKMNYKSVTNRYINPVVDIQRKRTAFLSLDSILPIGKYKERKVVDIINQDIGYILWSRRERVFLFNDDVLLLIKEKVKELPKNPEKTFKLREFTPYVKVERNACCKSVYVFDNDNNQVMSFESVVKAAEYFKIHKDNLRYYIKSRKRYQDKYLFSYSEYILFID